MALKPPKGVWLKWGKGAGWTLVTAACALTFFFVTLPLCRQGRSYKARTEALKNRQQQLQLFARRYDAREAGRRQQLLTKLQKRVPDTVSTEEWLNKLAVLAERSGVQLVSASPLPIVKGKGHQQLPLAISLEGDYTRMLLFLQLLEQDGQLYCMRETNVETKDMQGHLAFRTKLYVTALKQIS